jgi:hypothetical protein
VGARGAYNWVGVGGTVAARAALPRAAFARPVRAAACPATMSVVKSKVVHVRDLTNDRIAVPLWGRREYPLEPGPTDVGAAPPSGCTAPTSEVAEADSASASLDGWMLWSALLDDGEDLN